MIAGANELTTIKHMSCKCRCKFVSRTIKSKQKQNNSKCQCECKNPMKYLFKIKDYAWNPNICACEYDKHFEVR